MKDRIKPNLFVFTCLCRKTISSIRKSRPKLPLSTPTKDFCSVFFRRKFCCQFGRDFGNFGDGIIVKISSKSYLSSCQGWQLQWGPTREKNRTDKSKVKIWKEHKVCTRIYKVGFIHISVVAFL